MNTIIRTHVKNESRLQLLKRTIQSAVDKKLNEIGDIYIVDDQSPMQKEVIDLVRVVKIKEAEDTFGKLAIKVKELFN
jgi:hypothetical protein